MTVLFSPDARRPTPDARRSRSRSRSRSPPAARRYPQMLILNQADVRRLLPMKECVDVMTATLATLARGNAVMPLRTVFKLPDSRDFFAVMPAYLGEPRSVGAKVITVFPGNHGTALDS